MGWQRNHYDRLVHFASGLLIAPPASEWLQRGTGMRPLGAAIMSVAVVMSIGAIYEILEWQIAVSYRLIRPKLTTDSKVTSGIRKRILRWPWSAA